MYFRFNFLIEARLDDAEEILERSSFRLIQPARSAIARRGDALFAPSVAQVWIDEDGEEPNEKFVEAFLAPPYSKSGKVGQYIDTNLKSNRFRVLMKAMPDTFSNWH